MRTNRFVWEYHRRFFRGLARVLYQLRRERERAVGAGVAAPQGASAACNAHPPTDAPRGEDPHPRPVGAE